MFMDKYVGVQIYQGIRMIKQSEMRPLGAATFWDKYILAFATIVTPFLVCLKPKILPLKKPTFEKNIKDASLGRPLASVALL